MVYLCMRGKQKKLFTSKHQLKPGDYIVTKKKKAYEVVKETNG